jgi:outer membrane protein assembly factor BamB
MSTSSEFTRKARPSPLYLTAIVLLWGVFGFFTACQFLSQDSSAQDPERLKELRTVSLAVSRQSSSDWPQWRGPNRDGLSTETGLLTIWPEYGPRKLWEQPTGKGFSCTAVAQGKVITMLQDGDQEAIVCWSAETGSELWRYRYPASFHNEFGDGPRATPTIDGDLVFTVGATGIMTCLKMTDQKPELLWTKTLLEEFGAKNLPWGIAMSPLVVGDLVYVNPGGPDGKSLVAFEKLTGKVRWQALDDIGSDSSPVLAECAGVKQIVFFTGTAIVAVTPDEGKLLWRYPWVTDYGANIATPIVWGDYVYLSSAYAMGCALLKIDKTDSGMTAKLVYKNRKMQNHFSSCVLYQDHVYGFNDVLLTCMEFKTGKVRWTERGFDKGALTIADGHLFILSEKGILAVADASFDKYHETSRFSFSEKRSWTVPVIANGRMYVRDEEKIACFELKK